MAKTKNRNSRFIQEFNNELTTYRLNDETNELEVVEVDDLQEIINSHADTSLQTIYEKYMNGETITSHVDNIPHNLLFDDTGNKDTLHELSQLTKLSDEYKEKYNLPIEMSIDEVFNFVEKESKNLDKRIKDFEAKEKAKQEIQQEAIKKETKKEIKNENSKEKSN